MKVLCVKSGSAFGRNFEVDRIYKIRVNFTDHDNRAHMWVYLDNHEMLFLIEGTYPFTEYFVII